MNTIRRAVLGAIAAATLAPAASMAQAPAAWPSKPITMITPFPAGSGPDVVLRQAAEKLAKNLGQRVLVENRPGASGFIAIEAAQRAAPDGHTFLQLDSEHLAAVPTLYPKRKFRPFESLVPVATFYRSPFLVVVPADSPWKSVKDLVAAAKARPGQVNYGSWGVGSPGHLGSEQLQVLTDTQMQHVPFRVMGELFAGVGNGDVQWSFGSIASSQAAYRAGKVRYLAVAAPRRVGAMPDVPTMGEAGGPAGLEVDSFVVLMAPPGTPAPIVARMNAEMARVNADPDTRTRLEAFAFEPIGWSAEEIVRNAGVKAKTYGELIKRANIELE